MTRYRDLGLSVGLLPPGPGNAITDVEGVKVGDRHADRAATARSPSGPARSAPASP